MRRLALLLLLFLTPSARAGGPVEAVQKAAADVQKLPVDAQQHSLYLALYAIPEAERRTFFKLLTLHVNNISREAEITAPVVCDNELVRVDIRDYGWKKETINLLADVDPYFHVKLRNEVVQTIAVPTVREVTVPAAGSRIRALRDTKGFREDNPDRERGGIDKGDDFEVVKAEEKRILIKSSVGNVWVIASDFETLGETATLKVSGTETKAVSTGVKDKQTVTAAAPWLPAKEMAGLIAATQSQAPILRADWFFLQTARQIDRNNQAKVGYYEFLGIKKEADLEELAGLDRKTAERLRREQAAIIQSSTVTLHNRQIFAIQDGYWESRDVDNNLDDKNATRQLDKDYKFIAKEVYFRLPNGLWGLAAVNAANGELANSVPDSIASDNQSTSPDHRVAPALSCIRCHIEGLRPLDDWARRFYQKDVKLTSVDYNTLKRLRQLYLGPLLDRYEDDQRFYARVLFRTTGWEPKEAARLYKVWWQKYGEADVTGEQFARELGTDHATMLRAFKYYAAANPLRQLDPVLIQWLKFPEFPAVRPYAEEIFPLAMEAITAYRKEEERNP